MAGATGVARPGAAVVLAWAGGEAVPPLTALALVAAALVVTLAAGVAVLTHLDRLVARRPRRLRSRPGHRRPPGRVPHAGSGPPSGLASDLPAGLGSDLPPAPGAVGAPAGRGAVALSTSAGRGAGHPGGQAGPVEVTAALFPAPPDPPVGPRAGGGRFALAAGVLHWGGGDGASRVPAPGAAPGPPGPDRAPPPGGA